MFRRKGMQRAPELLVVVGLAALVFFLVREGRSKADQWSSILSGLFATLGFAGMVVSRVRRSAAAAPAPRGQDVDLMGLVLHLHDAALPLVGQLDPLRLGVKPAIGTVADDGRDLPAYVDRVSDGDLEWAIAEGGLVLLHGPAASGKTRSAFEAIRRLRPAYQLIDPTHPRALRQLLDAGYELRNAVIWLDDLERYLVPGGLDEGLLQRLCPAGNHDVVVLATIRDEELARLEQGAATHSHGELTSTGLDPGGARLVFHLQGRRRVAVGKYLTAAEKGRIDSTTSDQRVAEALRASSGFAEYLAAGPQMMRRWTVGDGPLFDVGQAVICAAVDCRRAGYHRPISVENLSALFRSYVSEARRLRADLPTLAEGLGWASQPVLGASSCLVPHAGNSYLASDYLVDQAQVGAGPLAGEIDPEIWRTVLTLADSDAAFSVAIAAYSASRTDIAVTAFRRAADAGHPNADYNLGVLLEDLDRQVEAEQSYRRAADAGHAEAMSNLGIMLANLGRTEDAEQWLRRAGDAGEKSALYNLGVLMDELNRPEDAERWWRKAAAAGHTVAMFNLGVVLREAGRLTDAEQWHRRAASQGHIGATMNVGVLLEEQGRVEEAEQWWRHAIDAGHTSAMFDLGVLLANEGRVEEAARWYRTGAEAGDASAMFNLAVFLYEHNDIAGAEEWYRRAAEVPLKPPNDRSRKQSARATEVDSWHWYERMAEVSVEAMKALGTLMFQRNDVEDAKTWWQRGAEAGSSGAMFNLGAMLLRQEQVADASDWLRRAADAGHTEATFRLGVLLAGQDCGDEAEQCYRRAAAAAHLDAINNLGGLLEQQDRPDEAEQWYRRAAEHGHAGAMSNLGVLLQDQDRDEEAEQWFRQAARAGLTNAMFNLAMLVEGLGRTEEAEQEYREAAKAGDVGSMLNLGMLFEDEDRDDEAEHWYRRAAGAGDVEALFRMGALLEMQDRVDEGEEWYRRAAEAGHLAAILRLDARSKGMSSSEDRQAESGDHLGTERHE